MHTNCRSCCTAGVVMMSDLGCFHAHDSTLSTVHAWLYLGLFCPAQLCKCAVLSFAVVHSAHIQRCCAVLLQQIMQLSPAQIEGLPPEQKAQVLALQQQMVRSTACHHDTDTHVSYLHTVA